MRSFLDVLTHYRRGIALAAVNDKLTDVVKAVMATNKGGEVTVTIKINPSKSGDGELTLKATVKAKVPEGSIPDAIFYADKDGGLHRTDPAQMDAFAEQERTSGAVVLDKHRPGLDGDQIKAISAG